MVIEIYVLVGDADDSADGPGENDLRIARYKTPGLVKCTQYPHTQTHVPHNRNYMLVTSTSFLLGPSNR